MRVLQAVNVTVSPRVNVVFSRLTASGQGLSDSIGHTVKTAENGQSSPSLCEYLRHFPGLSTPEIRQLTRLR